MSILKVIRWSLVRHYIIGILIGSGLTVSIFLLFQTVFLNEDPPTNSSTTIVQDSKAEVEVNSPRPNIEKPEQPRKFELGEYDPQTVWKALKEKNQIHIGRIAELVETINAWITQDGIGVLNEIDKSVHDQEVRAALFGGVIFAKASEIGFQDLFSEAQELLKDSEFRHEILWRVTKVWTLSDPIEAFNATSSVDTVSDRVEIRKSILGVWAKEDTQSLKESLHTMPNEVRNHATLVVMLATARQTPKDAVQFLSNITGTHHEEFLATNIANHWKLRDVSGALSWALEHKFSSVDKRNKVLGNVLHEIAKESPNSAFQIALNEPEDQFGKGPEVYLIENLASTDIDQAIELLDHVREGWSSIIAYMGVGDQLARRYEYDKAIRLSEQLHSNEDKILFYDSVFPRWAMNNPIDLFNHIATFPEKDIRSRAAMFLLEYGSYRPSVLTKKQLQEVMNFVSSQDLSEMRNRRSEVMLYDLESLIGKLLPDGLLQRAVAEHLTTLFQTSY